MIMNEDNLVSLADRTTDEKREIAIKGGIASGVARRKKKTMRENAELLLSLGVKNDKLKKVMNELGIDEEEQTNQMAMLISMLNVTLKGGNGAVQAFNSLQATVGEKPIEEIRQTIDTTVVDRQKNAIDDVVSVMKPLNEDDM